MNSTNPMNAMNPTNPSNPMNPNSPNPLFFLSIFVLLFAVVISLSLWLKSESSSTFKAKIEDSIQKELISMDQIPSQTKVDAIYVLGGSQKSLALKFNTAARLYHDGICNKILILDSPGITEYSRKLGRNLTNNEWAIKKLQQFGIPRENIEPISMESGFFGTLTEAKHISQLVDKKDYKNLILITAPYHTKRVKTCFENFLNGHNVAFYVQGSEERVTLSILIVELIKLKIYKYFLIS